MASPTTPRRQHLTTTPSTPASHAKAQDPPSSEKKRLNGIWQDDMWWCNHEPRQKAILREVKKEGPNKGRFFWTCATYPFCNFFLWRDDALIRESGLTAASDTELVNDKAVPPRPKTPTFTQKPLESYGVQTTPSKRIGNSSNANEGIEAPSTSLASTQTLGQTQASTTPLSPSTPSSKRKRNGKDAWDPDEFSDLDSDDERQLAEITDWSAQKLTPQRPADDIFTTPATNRRTTDIVGGLPTPSVSRTLFPTSEAKRSKTVSFEEPESSDALTTPSKTPSSHSSIDLASPSSSPPDVTHDVTEQVMALLKDQKIDPAVLRSVQNVLTTSARQTKGLSMGRDAARAALKDKDKKISQLQEKIRDLENTAAYNRKAITNMKSQIIRIYEEN